ncbi:MAG: hypothetical protein ACRDVN_02325 [Jiangellaceae bacterium]
MVTSQRRAVLIGAGTDAVDLTDRERAHRRDRVVQILAVKWRRRGRRALVRPL